MGVEDEVEECEYDHDSLKVPLRDYAQAVMKALNTNENDYEAIKLVAEQVAADLKVFESIKARVYEFSSGVYNKRLSRTQLIKLIDDKNKSIVGE